MKDWDALDMKSFAEMVIGCMNQDWTVEIDNATDPAGILVEDTSSSYWFGVGLAADATEYVATLFRAVPGSFNPRDGGSPPDNDEIAIPSVGLSFPEALGAGIKAKFSAEVDGMIAGERMVQDHKEQPG